MANKQSILLTGFGPFGNHEKNPSWLAVQEISRTWDRSEKLHIEEVPVAYGYVEEKIPQDWKELNPKLVLHVGVSGMEKDVIHLEKCAHSSGYIRPDVNGKCGPTSCSDEECLTTSLDVMRIVECCKGSFPYVKDSNNAGRYLCEYIYYTSLKMRLAPVLFIHVPTLDDDVTVANTAGVIRQIINVCLEQSEN